MLSFNGGLVIFKLFFFFFFFFVLVELAFNNFSFISRRYLVETGSSMLTFIVLPH